MRKSSRGNPYHDEKGRFTTSDNCHKRVLHSEKYYAERTEARIEEKAETLNGLIGKKNVEEVEACLDGVCNGTMLDIHYADGTRRSFVYSFKDGTYVGYRNGNFEKHTQESTPHYIASQIANGGKGGKVMKVEVLNARQAAKKMLKDSENRKLAEEAYERGEQAAGKKKEDYATKEEYVEAKTEFYEYVDSQNKMPWETDPKYKNQKNGRLMWLADHPEHRYNDPDLNWDMKRIQAAADRGVSKEKRQRMFDDWIDMWDLSEQEGKELLGEEFLR